MAAAALMPYKGTKNQSQTNVSTNPINAPSILIFAFPFPEKKAERRAKPDSENKPGIIINIGIYMLLKVLPKMYGNRYFPTRKSRINNRLNN